MTPNNQSNMSPGPNVLSHNNNEDFEIGSPPWPRTPASPVFNSHTPPVTQESFRSTKVTVITDQYIFLKVNFPY
jgi:hypothetical protein